MVAYRSLAAFDGFGRVSQRLLEDASCHDHNQASDTGKKR